MNRIKSSKSSNNDLTDLNEEELMLAIQIQPKREKSSKRKERMNLDAHIFEDFDLTATKKDELISAKFSDTFKQVLEGFPISKPTVKEHKLNKQQKVNDLFDLESSDISNDDCNNNDDLTNKKISVWNQKLDNQAFKTKLKLITAYNQLESKRDLSIKSNVKKQQQSQPQQDIKSIRPKTALSFSNSSITSDKQQKTNKNRPTSTKSEIITSLHRHNVSTLLFDGYEKQTPSDDIQHNSLHLDEDEFNYISPSFRIKKYNLNDQFELELAKKDILKRYTNVFKEPPSNKQRPKTNRLNRFSSATRINFSNPIKTF